MTIKHVTDQLGRTIKLPTFPPRRIVSLVPSQTELLADLGLEAEVVGITKFCVHPERWFRSKARVGGTKQVKMDLIESLRPDLIIANKEENVQEQIEALAADYPVWISDVRDLDSALEMIRAVGHLTGRSAAGEQWRNRIAEAFAQLPAFSTRSAAYLIWREPYMATASDTFIDRMMAAAGFRNVFAGRERYPEISPAELAAADPDVLLLSSEPYPFKEKHLAEFRELCPRAVIRLVDGELFSWYGSRLIRAPAYFRRLTEELMI